MTTKLEISMRNGMALRFRQGFGFYGVKAGVEQIVDEKEAESLVAERKLRIEGTDQWNVAHLALNRQGAKA